MTLNISKVSQNGSGLDVEWSDGQSSTDGGLEDPP